MSEDKGIVYDKSPLPPERQPEQAPKKTALDQPYNSIQSDESGGYGELGMKEVRLSQEPIYEAHTRTLDMLRISEVPNHMATRLKEAHFAGRLKKSLNHWIGALDGSGISDKATVKSLKALRREVTGDYDQDKPVLAKIIKTLDEFRPHP